MAIDEAMVRLRAGLDRDEAEAVDNLRYRTMAVEPQTVLRQVEALRQVIEAYEKATSAAASEVSSFARGQNDGFREALEFVVQSLASIYTDLTEKTENA